MVKELTHEEEIARLKFKTNKLLDKIDELAQEKTMLQNQIQTMKNGGKIESSKVGNFIKKDLVTNIVRDFCSVIACIVEKEQIIPFLYETKNSQDYYKVKKEVFEEYVLQISNIPTDLFIKYSVALLFIKSEKNGKCVFKSNNERIFFINKVVVDAVKQWIEEEKEDE